MIRMRKSLYVLLFGSLMLASQGAFALGLGPAEVRSYLGEALNARIELINANAGELNTMTAALASAADIERLGLTRTVSVPLHFRVNTDPADAYVEVSSRLPINDPVVQIVVQVQWSGGRMLREYNLFIDPPTVAARAPVPRITAAQQEPQPPAERYPDPAELDVVETRKTPPPPRQPAPVATVPAPAAADTGSTEAESAVQAATGQASPVDEPDAGPMKPAATVPSDHMLDKPAVEPDPGIEAVAAAEVTTAPGSDVQEPEQMPVETGDGGEELLAEAEVPKPEAVVEEAQARPEPATPETASADTETARVSPGALDDADQYGPVQRGDTLWAIAAELTRDTEYSVNQAMLAIQRLNPDAFGGNNINSLKRGAILRLPTTSEVRRLDRRQAMLEAIRQEEAYRAMRAGLPYDDSPPLLADAVLADVVQTPPAEDAVIPGNDIDPLQDAQAHLELIPPSSGEQSPGGTGDEQTQATGAMSSDELQEVLARTEEELANAQQENAYLSERIRELEEQLAEGGDPGLVENSEMAALESGLRAQRTADQPSAETGEEGTPGWMRWIIGLLAAAVVLLVWVLARMARGAAGRNNAAAELASESELQTVGGIRNEAEEILQTLDGRKEQEGRSQDNVVELEKSAERGRRTAKPADDTEVIELDTSDPETQLDLARAYISMGDADAARAMLQSVIQHGSDAQVSEARGMMKELEP